MMRSDTWFADVACKDLVRAACALDVSPNALTLVSLLASLAFPFLHARRLFGAAAACLVVHQVLDCLDGAVARTCHKESAFGMHFDNFSDAVLIVVIVHVVLAESFPGQSWPATLFVAICVYVIGFAAVLAFNADDETVNRERGEVKDPVRAMSSSLKTSSGPLPFLFGNSLVLVTLGAVVYYVCFRRT
jgi:phosphatidylglycerophosphate synthase